MTNKLATNPYYKGTTEMKNIIHRQTEEVSSQYGRKMAYITRKMANFDQLFGEDYAATFEGHHMLDFYINGEMNFGNNDMMSSFGIVVKDEALITVAGEYFRRETGLSYPIEGDLIFDPMTKRVFECKHVENESLFYALETLPQYLIKCELYTYDSAKMESGVREVDALDGIDAFVDANSGESVFQELTQQDNDSINDTLLEMQDASNKPDVWDDGGVDPDTDDTMNNWNEANPFG